MFISYQYMLVLSLVNSSSHIQTAYLDVVREKVYSTFKVRLFQKVTFLLNKNTELNDY